MEAAENKKPTEDASSPNTNEQAGEIGEENVSALKSVRSLSRLRDRVERAAHELHVLREENSLLQKRIVELESSSSGSKPAESQLFLFESDPESVKRKVEGFIRAIDRYLDNSG